jgi:hypothetical protein
MFLLGCSSTQSDLTPGHKFYTDFKWSFSETCADESDSVVISPKLFSVGNTACEIESYEDNHLTKIKLVNCASDKIQAYEKVIAIRTTYNAYFIDGWTENPQRLYRCSFF